MGWNGDGTFTYKSGKTANPDQSPPSAEEKLELDQWQNDNTPMGWINSIGSALGFNPKTVGQEAPGAALDAAAAVKQRETLNDPNAGLIASLQQQATTGDGAWQDRFKQAVQQSSANVAALGQSNPSTGYQSALRNIGNAQGAVAQRAVGDEAMLREQSKLDARGKLAGILGSQAQMDIGQSAEEARIERERRNANQALVDQSLENRQSTEKSITSAFSDGGQVPGRAQVFGDDEANDTQPAMLSPGEIVIPRSIVQTRDPEAISRFAQAVLDKGGAQKMAEGGESGIRDTTTEEKGGIGTGLLNFFLPHVGRQMEYDALRKNVGSGGGGTLNTAQYDQTAGQQDALAALFSGQAAGSGPSIVPMMQQRDTDESLGAAQAAQTRGGMPQGDLLQTQARAGNETAASAGAQKAREQSGGQDAFSKALLQRRAQEMQLASAKQQAAWQKTLADAGLTLKSQAQLRGSLAGAGQGAMAFANAGGGGSGGGDDPYASDVRGDRGGPADIGGSSGGKSTEPDFGEWDTPEFARGGQVQGYAGGGRIDFATQSRELRKRKLEDQDAKRVEKDAEQADYDRQIAETEEWEESEGLRHKPKNKSAERETAFARALRGVSEFAKKAGAGVSRMAEGGGVPYDAGLDPYAQFPFAPPPAPASVGTAAPIEPGMWDKYNPAALVDRARRASIEADAAEGAAASRLAAPPEAAKRNIAATPLSMTSGAPGMTGGPPPATKTAAQDALKSTPGLMTKEAFEASRAKPAETPVVAKAAPKGGGAGMGGAPDQSAADAASLAAAGAEYEAGAARSRAEVESATAKANAMETAANERKAVLARTQATVDEGRNRFDQAQQEMARIDTTVDPGRFWANKSTGDKVLGIMGLVLGALGAGPDGINRAAVMLNNAIDRDIELQKSAHEIRLKKGAANVENSKSFYAMARSAAQDELAANDLAHAAALDTVAMKGEALVAQTGDPAAKARLGQMVAAIRQGSAAKKAAGWEKAQDRAIEWAKVDAARAKSAPGAADAVKTAQEVKERAANIRTNLAAAQNLIDASGTFELAGGNQQKLEKAMRDIATDMAKLKDPGSVARESEVEAEMGNLGFTPGIGTVLPVVGTRNKTAKELLRNYGESVAAREHEALKVRGFQ